jgi:hypothetical protein
MIPPSKRIAVVIVSEILHRQIILGRMRLAPGIREVISHHDILNAMVEMRLEGDGLPAEFAVDLVPEGAPYRRGRFADRPDEILAVISH